MSSSTSSAARSGISSSPIRQNSPPSSTTRRDSASVDFEFAHFLPAIAVNLTGDDLRSLGQMRSHRLQALLEMVAVHVRSSALVRKGLHQNELVVDLETLRPVEEDVAGLSARGLGE